MKSSFIVMALLIACTAFAGPIEDFEAAIQSEDLDTRFSAAMSAGDLGADALPIAIKYWESENVGAQKAARVALPVIVRACQQPGNEAERAAACKILLEAAQPGTSDPIRREALFRLGAIASDDHVSGIAPLLSDAAVQEQAAQALENIPGPEATKALLGALDDAPPAFRVQIMFALAARGAEEAISAMAPHGKSSDERAKWGAIESLARLGVPPVNVADPPKGADPALRTRYFQATLDAADALAAKGDLSTAEKIYSGVLRDSSTVDHLVAFGLTGLAKIDSKKLTAQAISFLGIPGPHAAAMDVLTHSTQATTNRDLSRAFANVDEAKQCAIVRILHARKADELQTLLADLGDAKASVKVEAVRVQGESLNDADVLLEVAKTGPFFVRGDAVADVMRLAKAAKESEAVRIQSTLASPGYSPGVRAEALNALSTYKAGDGPLVEIANSDSDNSMRAAAQRAQIAHAAKFAGEGAEDAILAIVAKRTDHSIVDAAIAGMTTIGKSPASVAASLGFLAKWRLLGPLTTEQAAAAEASVLAGDALSAEGMPEWKDATIEAWPPIIDFRKHYARHRNKTAYARYADEIAPGKYTLAVGSDDGCVVYVDGEAVINKPESRGYVADQDKISITITKPTTSIVVKVMQTDADWRFSARLIPEQ